MVFGLSQRAQCDLEVSVKLLVRPAEALRDTRDGRTCRGPDLVAESAIARDDWAISNFDHFVAKLHGELPANEFAITVERHGGGISTTRANPGNLGNLSNLGNLCNLGARRDRFADAIR